MTQTSAISKAGIKYAVTPSSLARDPGYETETRDCFVQAVMYATGVPYRDAHTFVSLQFARKHRKGTCHVKARMLEIVREQSTIFGYRVFNRAPVPRFTLRRTRVPFERVKVAVWPTVAESLYTMRTGRFVVCSTSHAWAIIDGVIHDNGVTGNRTRVTEVYEFIPSSKCTGI